MKNLFLILPLVVLLSCKKDDPSPKVTELFSNTDVEAGTDTPTSWWLYQTGTEATFLWPTTTSVSGKHSLEIVSAKALSDVVYWGQSITTNIPYGKALSLNFKIKGTLTGDGAAVAIGARNSDTGAAEQFSTTQGTVSLTGNFDWTKQTVTLPAVKSDVKTVVVYLMLLPGASGNVYFDDIELTTE